MPRKPQDPIIGRWSPGIGDEFDDAHYTVPEGALDWKEWRAARISIEARESFKKRPFPSRSWQALFASSSSETTWPYTTDEISAIGETLPEGRRNDALQCSVHAARLYVFAQTRGHRRTANPKKEIEQLRRAIRALFDALKGLSPDASNYLRSKMLPWRLPEQDPFTTESLRNAIDRFDSENRVGLTQLPAAILGGGRERSHEKRLHLRLKHVFWTAHDGMPPKRGRPEFMAACLAPLRDFGMPLRSRKSDLEVARKRRKNPIKKRQVIPGDMR
jgi:hypothetical protein